MNKFLKSMSVIAMLVSSSGIAHSADLLLYTKPGGLFDRFNGVVQENLGDKFGKTVVVDSCVAAKAYLENTDQPTLTLWDPETSIGENPCSLDQKHFVSVFGTADWKLCSWKDHSEDNLETLLNGDVKIGAHKNPVWFNQARELMKSINPNAKIIPYGGSKEYMPALASGEIDFVFATSTKDGMVCHMTTAPEAYDGMIAASEKSSNFFAKSGYSAILVYSNMKDSDLDALVQKILSSESYKTQVLEKGYKDSIARLTKQEQIDFLNNFIKNLKESM